jgi:ABC-2 type transport system ATP-binding protein
VSAWGLDDAAVKLGHHVALDGIDLAVADGDVTSVVGGDGAGKTTLARLMVGLLRPSRGRVRRPERRMVGYQSESSGVWGDLTVGENLDFVATAHHFGASERSRRIDELLDVTRLGPARQRLAARLSGGMRQKLGVAMALLPSPRLLVLDEPTTGLDPAVRLALWLRIRELRARGKSVLLTTHYMDEAERLCDVVAILSQGRLVAQGPPRDLVAAHLARDAVELDCDPSEEARLVSPASGVKTRLRSGRRLVLFADDAATVIASIHERDGGDHRPLVSRPANLEDVFLLLTGTALEGGA